MILIIIACNGRKKRPVARMFILPAARWHSLWVDDSNYFIIFALSFHFAGARRRAQRVGRQDIRKDV